MELIKQPNGKYCSVNYDGNFIFNNYTEEEIVKMYIVMANDDMENNKSIGISYEDIDGELVYIFNIFVNDEYINIDGEYESIYDAVEIVTNEWNKWQ